MSIMTMIAQGRAIAIGGRYGTIFAPTSFSSRLNSGDKGMIFPAAARKRSTASAGRTTDVGC
jgi:hypothetical protein